MIRSQILIEVRNWCLLSSQKCSSQFIGIRNCYLHFSESVLSQYFYCWWVFLHAPRTRLRRLLNQNKQQMMGEKIILNFKILNWNNIFVTQLNYSIPIPNERRHQVLTSIRIWERSKENKTFCSGSPRPKIGFLDILLDLFSVIFFLSYIFNILDFLPKNRITTIFFHF